MWPRENGRRGSRDSETNLLRTFALKEKREVVAGGNGGLEFGCVCFSGRRRLCMLIGIMQDRVERNARVKHLGGQERSRSSEPQRGWSHDGLITGRRAE